MPPWLEKLLPIVLLLVAVSVVVARLPRVDLGHEPGFLRRRRWNWIVLGLTYAFLYFGRYNLSAIVGELEQAKILTKEQFNELDAIGLGVYGVAFLLNGPLTDRWGGRATILIAAGGSALMNAGMALAMSEWGADAAREGAQGLDLATGAALTGAPVESAGSQLRLALTVLNAANMYFQSFGAVSIVKVNAHWFHVRERGVLGGLFGILISLGLYFSYDWSLLLTKELGYVASFWTPCAVLAAFFVAAWFAVRDSPGKAGWKDFDTGDATSGQLRADGLGVVVRKLLAQRIVWLLVAIEFCSGFLRQAAMKQFRPYAKALGESESFVYQNWGMLLCVAGILGGVFAGTISDHVFGSRRGPVASILYAGMLLAVIGCWAMLGTSGVGWSIVFLSLCVIGVHGMLSGTASADFGGTKNAGIVTGVIDGFVYLGSATQAFVYATSLPKGDAAKDAANWTAWPLWMMPVVVIGLLLCTRVWNARPKAGGGH
ncbi:MAG: MFS transporter [Planctomycetes bacterium]|nr:MFS transporter [Planctomycetota bacterium]